ncbi:phage resistance protein [Pseudomonas aeruginosa]|uniref:phage resistance protein n=2 Tax=Gammaproteobacteria TaxID=1236 RepID=UPI0008A83486|nr:phage resistance protein [Pseudomonas aeruginosa]EIU3096989.1 phage resistance protein [Pseudomonas aeruginosa]MBD1244066.1 phage resistance protein [Pseudomonas aeruginosa]MBI7374545.1 phage resistance protein [Pseudomonas aeruginosa]MCK1852434.1 phage resistance protein [Pseudomonas aeruginosa]MCK1863254.1 phage resistance protein [Pseudomonas aeruginosa]
MTLIKELIEIPEKVQRGDFVLNLSSGLADAAISQTLEQYVVTPQLQRSFDDALSFIKSTVVGNQNRQKGAYLHGSFGSGKSHFMAVLHLLLQGNSQARAINELAPAVAKHDEWLQQTNILLVPYHMIGAASIEAGVLGGYARHIKQLHPDAPVPGFYMSDRLFRDARQLRSTMGDANFFATLNNGAAAAEDDGWGDLSTGWDAASFDAVLNDQAGADDKARLVGDLIGTFYSSMADMANSEYGGYVDFDEGLRIMTEHAKALGYDAIILFLDELILWLASHLSDQRFIANNIQKVVKLVEASEQRALPMASFIARQRDLREFVGDQYNGAEQQALSDSLKYWDGRFHTITLEDRNLPVIAERRLLKPINAAAKAEIDNAFAAMDAGLRSEVQEILLTNQGDREMFRSLYPFSPALVQALVALSSALQRERTALKVMLMLLVDQRETLELGGCIPVGDLYDVIASEAEPFSEVMRMHFDNARHLFERKLVPLLEEEHNLKLDQLLELPANDPGRRAFTNDMRLIKTLLLSALVPEVECFKQLTANKLAALNHGTIKSPIPGREAQTVLQKCRKWAGRVGEIKISDDSNPVIAIQLSGVDTESILEQAKIHDNDGARRKLTKDLLFEAFGVQDDNQLFIEHPFAWRGTRRTVEVMFQNIREISDFTTFEARGDDWKVLVDFPFDQGNHSPASDRARIQEYEATGNATQTLCWLPYFFSQSAQRELGTLVTLEHVLKSDDRFASFSKHLSPIERGQARTLLDNQRSQLRQRIRDYLMGAFGAAQPLSGSLDDSVQLESQVYSLEPGFTPQLPVGSNLRAAFEHLLNQALSFQYPDHPEFDGEVRLADLGKVMEQLRRAVHASNGRIDIDTPLRSIMRSIAQPLKLGEMHERHFIFKDDWPKHMTRELAKDEYAGDPVTVKRLRSAIDQPTPKGLPDIVQNLLIMVFAEHGQYAFSLHGQDYEPTLKDMPDNLLLTKQDLAEPNIWKLGVDNASAIFGLTPNKLRTANHQNALEKDVQDEVKRQLGHCEELVTELRGALSRVNQGTQCNRLRNAEYAVSLLQTLQGKQGADLIAALADIQPPTNAMALAKSIVSAASVTQAIQDNNWQLLETVWKSGAAEALQIKQRVSAALTADELVTALAQALRQAQADATSQLTRNVVPPTSPDVPPADTSVNKGAGGRKVLEQVQQSGLTSKQARNLFAEIESKLQDGYVLDVSYSIVRMDGVED